MEKFDFRKYKYIIAIAFIFIIFIMLVANAYKYLPKHTETNNMKQQYIEVEDDYNKVELNEPVESDNNETLIEEEDTNKQEENKFANFFNEEEKNLDFKVSEHFKELSDEELE